MNINELNYFKTIQCGRKDKHDVNICYFYHHNHNDKRRELVNTKGEFSLDNKYSNQLGFGSEKLNRQKVLC